MVIRVDGSCCWRRCGSVCTGDEMDARQLFEYQVSKGHSIPLAASLALNKIANARLIRFSPEFIENLSDGTCRQWGDRVLIKAEWRGRHLPNV